MKEGLTKGLNTVTQGWLEFEVSAQTSGVCGSSQGGIQTRDQ